MHLTGIAPCFVSYAVFQNAHWLLGSSLDDLYDPRLALHG